MIAAHLIELARDTDLLGTAENLGAKLKRTTAAEWTGPCPTCGGTDRFSINVKQQVWHCRGCGKGGGDAISLVSHLRGLNFRESVAFLARNVTPVPARAKEASEPDSEETDAFVERLIASIVREMVPVSETPAKRYLADVRKIDTDAIVDVLERIDAIGWHPSVLFREQGHPLDGERLGCIVGVMTDPVTAKPTGAISRTYLHEGLKVGKAKTLGSPVGIVRLSADEDVVEGLCLAEGLETCLAAMAKGFRPCWSTGSAGIMAAFPVLAGVEALTLVC